MARGGQKWRESLVSPPSSNGARLYNIVGVYCEIGNRDIEVSPNRAYIETDFDMRNVSKSKQDR